MKKITVAFVMLFIIGGANAQDFKKVSVAFLINKIEDAKTELDKIMADPKTATNADAQLWKARIYSALYAEPNWRAKYPQAGDQSIAALKTYMQLDPETKKLKEAGMQVIDEIYVTNFNLGRGAFDREQWDSSLSYFKNSYEVGKYITKKNWRNNNQVIDTFTVLFTAYAAQNSKKLDEAANYYKEFADLKIGGKEYESVYEFLAKLYLEQKNRDMFNKYVGFAKELYPQNTVWKSLEAAYLEDNSTLAEKLKSYDDGVAGGKMTSDDYFNYGSMFANVNKEEAKALDSLQLAGIKKKAVDAFKKSFEMENTNSLAAYNVGVLVNNDWNEYQERYRNYVGAAAGLKLKRDEIDKQSAPVALDAIQWLEKAFNLLDGKAEKSRVEKNSYSTSIKLLANLYEYMRDKSKGKSPQDFDNYSKKFNFYNAKVGS